MGRGSNKQMKIAFIGLGKLGLPVATVMSKSYDLTGYDIRETKGPVRTAPTLAEAVEGAKLIFVAIQTPHAHAYGGETPSSYLTPKDFDYQPLESCLADLNKVVNQDQIVVLISTVLPGTIRNRLRPCISNARFIYNPYLVAMGTVEWDMVHPEMVIIGTEDGSMTGDADLLTRFYKGMIAAKTRYVVGTWEEAESTKVFYNTWISMKLALVNMVMDVAHRVGHMNCDVVTSAIAQSTQRIMSSAYMKPGMGDSSGCHPRDGIALSHLAKKLRLGYDIFGDLTEVREQQARNIARLLESHGKDITILGRTNKPGVPYTDGSYASLITSYFGPGVNCTFDADPEGSGPRVYLLAHRGCHYDWPFIPKSTIIDPWRECPAIPGCLVIRYGDTRPQVSS